MSSHFIGWEEAASYLRGKSVAIVGSAPSVLDNRPGFIDGFEVVVRVNNYKTGYQQGYRCDVHYAFYGNSVRSKAEDLKRDGVKLCWCKCPDAKPLTSEYHERHNKPLGVDFRYIYKLRQHWWFCPTYVPTVEQFMRTFHLLGGRIPTTGFAAILDVLACEPRNVYLTGYDFFSSGVHNVNEPWSPGDPRDPLGHRPDLECDLVAKLFQDYPSVVFEFDKKLADLTRERAAAAAMGGA